MNMTVVVDAFDSARLTRGCCRPWGERGGPRLPEEGAARLHSLKIGVELQLHLIPFRVLEACRRHDQLRSVASKHCPAGETTLSRFRKLSCSYCTIEMSAGFFAACITVIQVGIPYLAESY
jgi:hypothetical protein